MSTRNFPEGKGRPVHKAGHLTAICEPILYKNVEALTSHNPNGLHGLLQGYFYSIPLPKSKFPFHMLLQFLWYEEGTQEFYL
jgi:hypothetical protein